LYVNQLWGLGVWAVGLVYMGCSIPSVFGEWLVQPCQCGSVPVFPASPLAGRIADKIGLEFVPSAALVLAIPWGLVLIVKSSLALFIAAFIIQSESRHDGISPALVRFRTQLSS
jgi:hypothetical protein